MIEVAPGILWLRLALPYRLDHVNVYLIEDGAGFAVLDTGLDDAPTRAAWEALLKDANRAGDVQDWLQRNLPGATTIVQLANKGSHTDISGDLITLVRSAEQLCKRIQEGPGGAG